MNHYLVFDLYGPMVSWGEVAVGSLRGTETHPTRSAILGLVAAALGLKRTQGDELAALDRGFGFASCVYDVAQEKQEEKRSKRAVRQQVMQDYHTAQSVELDKKYHPRSRRTNLQVARNTHTILSKRDYICDAHYSIAIWVAEPSPWTLSQLGHALEHPVFCLYLGRKAHPLALPVCSRVIEAEHILGALQTYRNQHPLLDSTLFASTRWFRADTWSAQLYWEGNEPAGIDAYQTVIRRDRLASRKRWQFYERTEHQASVSIPQGGR